MTDEARSLDLPRETGAALVGVVAALALSLLVVWRADDFALDDAWIHLSYAKSVKLGDGWSYNPGDHEAGCSSPLWVALLVVWPTGTDPLRAVAALGALLHAVAAWTGAALAIALVRQHARVDAPIPLRSIAMLAGVLVATSPLMLHGVGSGMEVPLACAVVLAMAWAIVEGHTRAAAVLGAAACLARPELALIPIVWSAAMMVARARCTPPRRRAAMAASIGALVAAAVWAIWTWSTVGDLLPNAFYIKGRGGGFDGLAYLADAVLPWQPWLVGLGGLVLGGLAIRHAHRSGDATIATLAVTAIVVTILVAMTRPLHPGVQFFEARYFVPLLAPLPVVLAVGLVDAKRLIAIVSLVPVALVTGLQTRDTATRVAEAAEDTRVLHHQPAQFVAANLPADAIVAVEGAGASRYFAPRTMTIVDLVGLNDHVSAHLHRDRDAKMCHWIARRPTHAVIPAHWGPILEAVFEVRPVAVFDDPSYTQVEPPSPMRVVVAELGAPRRSCVGL